MKIARRPVAKKVVDLEQQVQEEWMGISQEIVERLIDSMPQRIAEVIKSRGGHTHF
jgi:predicted DNA-binding protein (UPF0251 family)